MILNNSANYALRAVLYLAGHPGAQSADVMAAALGVPRNYLGKVLNTLAQEQVLVSTRGPRGGFELAADADNIRVESVVMPFQETTQSTVCLLGDRPCNSRKPCRAHERWLTIAEPVARFFATTTIAQMLEPVTQPQVNTPVPAEAT